MSAPAAETGQEPAVRICIEKSTFATNKACQQESSQSEARVAVSSGVSQRSPNSPPTLTTFRLHQSLKFWFTSALRAISWNILRSLVVYS
jgi:hypothetical protein